MEKKIVTIITILIVLVGLPYVIYNIYINHQDDLYRTLTEYSSYTTLDKKYDIKIMKYRGVTGGEEVHDFKVYIVQKSNDKAYFVKNVSISAYGTNIEFSEDTSITKNDLKIMFSSSTKKELVTLDMNELRVKGQKFRAFLF